MARKLQQLTTFMRRPTLPWLISMPDPASFLWLSGGFAMCLCPFSELDAVRSELICKYDLFCSYSGRDRPQSSYSMNSISLALRLER